MSQEGKKCSACGADAAYVQDVDLSFMRVFLDDYARAALYRCPACGHIDLYEPEEERRRREEEARQAELPDYCCPSCGRVGKWDHCPLCQVACEPLSPPSQEAKDGKKKKRRWFGRDDEAGRED